MSAAAPRRSRRVLVIDDNRAIHDDFRKILAPPRDTAHLDEAEALLFGSSGPATPARSAGFEVDSAHQGQEGLAAVLAALAADRPYAMAFVDMRMPPGWDGLQTTRELWKAAPDLQVVICTAYSDYSWETLLATIGDSDRMVILKKPFDPIEVLQLANALTEKWNLLQAARLRLQDLEAAVAARTAELQEANRRLGKEVAERRRTQAELVRARDAAEAADRAKSAFLANMSHEIRTPMNGVIGMANLLLETELDEEQRDLTRTLNHSGETLLAIINDILDFSKIEAGKLTLEAIDFEVAELIEDTLDLHAEAAAGKGLEIAWELAPDVPARVRGDPVRLRQVLLNLVSNAVKFTARGEIHLRAARVPAPAPEGGAAAPAEPLRFEVIDQGIGIPAGVQATLFQPFTQADSTTTRKFGGTGLGLAISRRLVEAMGGTIGVTSTPGAGSTFWFEIPFAPAAEPAPACTGSGLEAFRVLAVDDNPATGRLLETLCARWRLPCVVVRDGAAARERLRAAAARGEPLHLALVDYSLPDGDGLALCDALRRDSAFPAPKLVLLAPHTSRLSGAELARHGLAGCQLKPIRSRSLRECLLTILRDRAPAAKPVAAPAPAVRPEVPVLVAEDNPVNQRLAVLQLRRLGYPAHVVANGEEALAALRRTPYRVVLLDAQMPVLDGLAVARRIRAAQRAGDPTLPAEVHLIAMTANAAPGDRQACLNAGMDEYIAKPVRLPDLRRALEAFLEPQPAQPA